MMASRNLVLFIVLALILLIHGQEDDKDIEPTTTVAVEAIVSTTTVAQTDEISLEDEFPTGLCPEGFHQLGDECVYFLIEGTCFAWKNAQCICSQRIDRVLRQLSLDSKQKVVQPVRGARLLTLNTPEKTKLLRAFIRDYNRTNYAIQLLHDYDKLERCNDGTDDYWPDYCDEGPFSESACFETTATHDDDICLQEVPCNETFLRVACEFTLPGRPELKESKFRHCSNVTCTLEVPPEPKAARIPLWVWIVIGVLSGLLLLAIIVAVVAFILMSRKGSTPAAASPKAKPVLPATRLGPENNPLLTNA